MFNFSFTTYVILTIVLLVIILTINCTEHFSPKKKNIHMVKVHKPQKGPVRVPASKPSPQYMDQTNAQLNRDRETHEHHHHYYDYSYPNYWYEYLYPQNWFWSWWGYPSEYDPKFSVPYLNDRPMVNIGDNCHKKCIDRYENEVDTLEYQGKVENCINEYCY